MSDGEIREEPPAMPNSQGAPWGRYGAIMAALGAVSIYIVNNWAMVEPVLQSPAIIVLAMLAVFGLGGLSAYWLLARPHEDRLRRAEAVINRLREQERSLLKREGDLKAQVAALEATVLHLKEEVAEMKSQLHARPESRPRKPRAPKS